MESSRPEKSLFHQKALNGEPLHGELLLDSHTHLGRTNIYHLPDAEPADLVREMDRLGVQAAVVFSYAGVTGDYQYGNDLVAAAVREYPGRFIGFALVSPNYPDEMLSELERCRALGLRGIKLIPSYQGYPEEGEALHTAYAFAHEHHWPVLSHNFGRDDHLRQLARDYPNAIFIRGHGTWRGNVVVRDCANVYDCTVIPPYYGYVERMARFVGPEKILWGSDAPDLPTLWSLGPVLTARIPDDWKRLILGGNLQRILDQCRP